MDSSPNDEAVGSRQQVLARLEPVWRWVRSRFTVDTRSLAVLRVALGLLLLIDLVHRTEDMVLFYTDDGAYPLAAYEATYTYYNEYSLHALSGDLWFQQLLFVVAGLFALAFLVGYRTRLAGAVSLALLVSLHARNPAVLNGGDILFRVLLFVSLVTPLGERWSVDALRRSSARTDVAGVGTAALLVQPVVVFTSNAVLKHRGDHWYAGEAVEIALANDAMTKFLGNVLVDFPTLLTVFNYAWVTLLAGSVVFLLVAGGRLRALALLAYVSMFAGMLLTMAVGLFPLVLTAAVVPYLTAPFWDALARRVPDGAGARVPSAARLGPLGRPPLERRLLDALCERGHATTASYAASVARSTMTVAGVLVLAWILVFAVADVSHFEVPDSLDNAHLDQQDWGLYAPDPSKTYSWYVVAADLEDGSSVDVLHGGPAEMDRPPDASKTYPNFRHRKFMRLVRHSGAPGTNDTVAESFAGWACRRANATHDARVERVTVYQFVQASPIDGEHEEPTRNTVIERDCSRGAVDRVSVRAGGARAK